MKLEKIGEQTTMHNLFGGVKTEPRHHNKFKFSLMNLEKTYECKMTAYDEDVICAKLPNICPGPWISSLRSKNIVCSDVETNNEPFSVMIGADVIGKLYTGKMLQVQSGPTILGTKLGWTVSGKNDAKRNDDHEDAALTVFTMFNREAKVSDLWDLDLLGISDPITAQSKTEHQESVQQHFSETVKFLDGRYEMSLPWKDNHPELSGNLIAAEKRLKGLTKKLNQEKLFQDYHRVLMDWLHTGIIETVSDTEASRSAYYLPHRHVVKMHSTTRIRPVFDASAKSDNGPSLNQCLETGPNLIELIPSILLRFREHKIGIIADITKAFLQISVNPKDRDALKFLWYDEENLQQVNTYRHCRVVFGLNSSPFLLGATIEHHLKLECESAASSDVVDCLKKLKRSFYLDNCVTSVSTVEEKTNFQTIATKYMCNAGFNLRDWECTGEQQSPSTSSVLGVLWDKCEDVLCLNWNFDCHIGESLSKRDILTITHRIFDPLGWASPTLLIPKLILKTLWKEKVSWDAQVPNEIASEFKDWLKQVPLLKNLTVPRWIFGLSSDAVSYHMFVDASKNAYAAVLYVRTQDICGRVRVHLVQSKSRVGPTAEISIPRMELLAATLGARLAHSVEQSMGSSLRNLYFWTDSSTVLSWLRRNQQWARFVWNRVAEIKKFSDVKAWRHVPGILNPADLPSRGCTSRQLLDSYWIRGPSWLKAPESQWPVERLEVEEDLVNAEKAKCSATSTKRGPERTHVESCTNFTCVNGTANENDTPWYLERFSSYNKTIRTMAWITRFVGNSRPGRASCSEKEINGSEFERAERLIMKLAQKESFTEVSDPRLQTSNVYVDEHGLIRTKTLISNRTEDNFDFRYPIVLDAKHEFTLRLIRHTHEKLLHAGIGTTIQVLRETVWILSSRRTVRSVINKFVRCRRHSALTLKTPPTSLPEDRVRDAKVFEIIGVDYAGPLYLREEGKAWICLFTCAVYRAVHLELVSSLSMGGFLDALRRFISRRGRPKIVYSDQGTNFRGADNLLATVDWDEIQKYCSTKKITWKFNPPASPWWGGWWERIVRIVKDLLKRSLGKASLNYEEMNTILCDCEAVINARPISYQSDEKGELIAITPAMLLKEIEDDTVPDLDQIDAFSCERRLKYRSRLRNELRARFRSEYLGQLCDRVKSAKTWPEINVGDIVLIANDNTKRMDWPLAKVTYVVQGKDGVPRVARLKTASGEVVRPFQRLLLLEKVPRPVGEEVPADKQLINEVKDDYVAEPTSTPAINQDTEESAKNSQLRSRRGRIIKKPARLGDFV
uniref:Integrase catalytic domain-containing protein n=1 Tax=Trichogramma kaykai TaxID=54128 RepID=A0ABD2W647_9HYME